MSAKREQSPELAETDPRSENTRSLKERVDALTARAFDLAQIEPEQSRRLVTEALQLVRGTTEFPYPDGLALCLLIESIQEWDLSNYQEALALVLEAESRLSPTSPASLRAKVTGHMAGIHFFLGDYARALELGHNAVKMAEDSGDPILLADLLNDTGYMSLHDARLPNGLPQLMRSLNLHRANGSQPGEAQVLDSIGKAYYLMQDYDQALHYAFESLAIDERIGYARAEADALNTIGKICAVRGEIARALDYFEQSLALATTHGYRQIEAINLLDIGRAQANTGNTTQAFTTLGDALNLAQDIGSRLIVFDIHLALANAYEQVGDLTTALAHYKQFHAVKEEVFYEQSERILRSLRMISEAEHAKRETEIYQVKNLELQREIEEREKLIAELDAFTGTVAHDLKNPLMVITGYSEMLYDDLVKSGPKKAVQLAQEIVQAGDKTSRIIDELLLLASVRRQDVTLRPLDMAAIVAESQKRLVALAMERDAQIVVPDSWPEALGYAPWVEEVWANYLSNAITYGGTPPVVELGATQDEDYVRFWVQDNGNGVGPEAQSLLFKEFSRLNSIRVTGHGLGLSIVQRIMDKLGGDVGIESTGRPGEGSLFYFVLPAVNEAHHSTPERS